MKNIFKKIGVGVLAGTMVFSTSCTNLDEKLYDQLNETNIDLNSTKDLELVLGAAVAQYRYLVEDWFGMFHLLEESTDQYMVPARIGVGWGDAYINLHRHDWGTTEGQIQQPWDLAYKGVAYANMVCDICGDTDSEMRAQARFFRAMFYYHLLDMFGNPPLQTTQNFELGYLPEQVGTEKLYNWIVDEFKYVEDHITSNKDGWGNKAAAQMALAKLYLNKNAYLGTTGNDGFEKALEYVNKVIASGEYSLAPAYSDCFKAGSKNCPETIFCIPGDQTHTSQFGLQSYCFPQTGLLAYNSTAAGYNGSCGIPQWIKTYDAADQRLTDTWAFGKQYYGEGHAQEGQPIPFAADDWAGEGYLNYNVEVHSIDNPGAYQQEGARLHKYEIMNGTNDGTTAVDLVVFRYTDALMIKAECLLRIGNASDKEEAAKIVTDIRRRSFPTSVAKATRTVADLEGGSVYAYGHQEFNGEGLNNWEPSAANTYEGGADIELGGLLDDLGWEFACELHRRQDLRRFHIKGSNLTVWNAKSWFCKDANTSNTYYDVYSIPQSARDTNIKLKQNPGY
ncbi:MAG: RagB/SusD family nutrient uptake outer membrane protein [Bacteroidaceae bacterium]|nr:RagB/SusD family nutrient uptake outer membrane protein [Bacteroidaceae bacterium]